MYRYGREHSARHARLSIPASTSPASPVTPASRNTAVAEQTIDVHW